VRKYQYQQTNRTLKILAVKSKTFNRKNYIPSQNEIPCFCSSAQLIELFVEKIQHVAKKIPGCEYEILAGYETKTFGLTLFLLLQ